MVAAGTAFDALATRYDELWNKTAVGVNQRQAVWRRVDPFFQPGDCVLDLGCGTGEDALYLESRGVDVYAIDASAAMVKIARQRGVNAHRLTLEAIGTLHRTFDGVLCNFGVLNCIEDFQSFGLHLSQLVRPGGFVALCVIGPFCLRETLHFIRRGQPRQAFRRLHRGKVPCSLGIEIRYPSVTQLNSALGGGFRLIGWCGVGLCVPPSYVQGTSQTSIERLSRLDRHLTSFAGFRAMSDHRLFVFKRR